MNAKNAAAADLDAAIAALKVLVAENLPLVAKGTKNGSAITWSPRTRSSLRPLTRSIENKTTGADDPYRGAGIINRPPTATVMILPVTLTATASYNGGEKVTKTIEVTVKEKTCIAPDTGYAAVTLRATATVEKRPGWLSTGEETISSRLRLATMARRYLPMMLTRVVCVTCSCCVPNEGDKYYLIAN